MGDGFMYIRPVPAVALSSAILLVLGVSAEAKTSTAAPVIAAPHASPAAAPGPAGSTLVKVSNCSPQRNDQQGSVTPAYVAGSAGQTNWSDVYGNTYYQPANVSGPQLLIAFTNISHKAMHVIEFGLLSNEILAGEVRDSGTFSPGVLIKHKLALKLNAILPGSSRCVPLRVTFADGTKWRNPRLPPKGQALYFNSKIPPKTP
jgi:hypothetical protein